MYRSKNNAMNLGGVIRLNRAGLCLMVGALLVLSIYMLTNSSSSSPTKHQINLRHLLQVAIKAAENGGIEVVNSKDNLEIKSKGLTKEGMIDSVTTADFLSHCSILETLKHSYPTLKVISEEAKTKCDKSRAIDLLSTSTQLPSNLLDLFENEDDVTVWIDPLDATYEYTEKLFKFVTTMVCVAVKGVPVVGVIHKPFLKQTSWAWVGKARSSDLSSVTLRPDGGTLKITISRSHSGEVKDVIGKMLLENYELVVAAGAGYKALEVATGKVDAYLHVTAIKKWDICAGDAIISAVGGKMTTRFDETIDYSDSTNVKNMNGLVASLKNHYTFISKLSNK